MSLLERLTPTTASDHHGDDASTYVRCAGYGGIAALALLLVAFVPILAGWTLDPRSSTGWTDCLGMAAASWGLAHHGQLAIGHGSIHSVVFAPLGLTALAVVFAWRGARGVLGVLADLRLDPARWWRPWVAFVIGYAGCGVALALLASVGPAGVHWWSVIPGALIVAGSGAGWAIARDEVSDAHQALTAHRERVAVTVLRSLRPGLEGFGALLACGVVVVAAAITLHLTRIGAVSGMLDISGFSVVLLWLAQLMVLPNFVISAAAWTTGAPIDLGAATASTASVHPGSLPAVPLLGMVPDAGAMPGWVQLVMIVPVLCGLLIGYRVSARLTKLSAFTVKVRTAASAGAVATVAFAVAVWWSRGGLEPGSLDTIGPAWWSVLIAGLEMTAAAVALVAARHWWSARR